MWVGGGGGGKGGKGAVAYRDAGVSVSRDWYFSPSFAVQILHDEMDETQAKNVL